MAEAGPSGWRQLAYTHRMSELLSRITVEPGKMGGKPCIRGLRIRVTDVLDLLAEGLSHEEVLGELPNLEPMTSAPSLLMRRGG